MNSEKIQIAILLLEEIMKESAELTADSTKDAIEEVLDVGKVKAAQDILYSVKASTALRQIMRNVKTKE